ncbi:MAG TPA: ribbon-helix-helix domain-containing protein [Candidatus Dormibacteraeota bacterium]|nr:ribbon-helix-helix domain-containing protein [Candidatus Dormibacteraeota bacterium]
MKTTLVIDDHVMRKLKQEAAARRQTVSALVEAALRQYLAYKASAHEMPPLPCADLGAPAVDVADREALYQAMEGR